MKIFFLLALAVVVSYCKTTQNVNRRHTHSNQIVEAADPVLPLPQDTVEKEQTVTTQDIQSAPAIKVETVTAPPVMVPEIGSQCKAPVSASCLGLVTNAPPVEGSGKLGIAIKKYGRALTPAVHACNYYQRNFSSFPNISAFDDAVVYWTETPDKISYRAFPVNFLFAAGCSLGEDFKNPFAAELTRETVWDGSSTLQSLGYRFYARQSIPANFAADLQKAEKMSQASHRCDWAIRPLIYAFPDGVIYQMVGGSTLNIYAYNQVKAMGCQYPPKLAAAAEALALTCGQTTLNPDSTQRQSLADFIGPLPATSVRKFLDRTLLNQLELNGKPVAKASLNCTFAARNRILQFADGFAFIDDYCADVNIYTTQYVKDQGCMVL